MPYGNHYKPSPTPPSDTYYCTFKTPRYPKCPNCAEWLHHAAIHVRDGVVLCSNCGHYPDVHSLAAAVLTKHGEARDLTIDVAGLIFYAPKDPLAGPVQEVLNNLLHAKWPGKPHG